MIPGHQPAELETSPFPADVAYACLRDEQAAGAVLAPEEEAILSPRAVDKRRAEFRLGRLAARLALERHGFSAPPPVLKGASREPLWPAGIVGSISHTGGVAIAAVAGNASYAAIGLDIETADGRSLEDFPLDHIASVEEAKWIRSGRAAERAIALFSAKESIYKALFPLCRRYIGFGEVVCSWDDRAGGFRCELRSHICNGLAAGRILTVGVRTCGPVLMTFLALAGAELKAG